MNIAAPHLASLFSYAHYQGVAESALRKYLTNRELDVCDPEKTVSEGEFLAVLQELVRRTGNPYFGLHYGSFLNLKALGFILRISLNTSAIEQAVLILQQYLRNSFPIVALTVAEGKGRYTLQLSSKVKNEELRKHMLDSTYCFIYRELKLMLPPALKPDLELACERPEEYSRFFREEVRKGSNYSLSFERKIRNAEINKQRVKEIEFLLPEFLQMLEGRKPENKHFSHQLRGVVLNMCSPGLPDFEQVAAQFPLSKRTIQRKLTEEGTSFRKITNEIRKELADYLTTGRKMKTKEVAAILGYSEPSAYLHAAKKWKAELSNLLPAEKAIA